MHTQHQTNTFLSVCPFNIVLVTKAHKATTCWYCGCFAHTRFKGRKEEEKSNKPHPAEDTVM